MSKGCVVSANGLNTVLDGEDIESGLTLQTFEHVLFFVLAAIWSFRDLGGTGRDADDHGPRDHVPSL